MYLPGRSVGCQLRGQLADPRLPAVNRGSSRLSAGCSNLSIRRQAQRIGPETHGVGSRRGEAPSGIEPDYAALQSKGRIRKCLAA